MAYTKHIPDAERSLLARAAAHQSWANTTDRTARTAKAREAMYQKFLAEADGDAVRAESLRKAFYARLTAASNRARRLKAAANPREPKNDELLSAINDLVDVLSESPERIE